MEGVDTLVIGGGVIGLAVARSLALEGREVVLVERHGGLGHETSGRNSEVIHAGIYYPQGSLKASLCVEGKARLYHYCASREVGHQRLGKVIVAVEPAEEAGLARILAQAEANGVDDLRPLDATEVGRLEPAVQAVAGLFSPSTGIVDAGGLMRALRADLLRAGGHVVLGTAFLDAEPAAGGGFTVRLSGGTVLARRLVNAAGLSAPDVARRIAGVDPSLLPAAHYCKGHYYQLSGASPFRHLVYPVPVAGGLGVHVTLDLGGRVRFGPDVRWVDAPDDRFDDSERAAFVAAIRRYYPGLDPDALSPGFTGVRPKLVGPGEPDHDFVLMGPTTHGQEGLVHLLGLESPGLTASLAIAERVRALLA
jgi:L-2-hydroxyglutarate oxidase LhgO